MTAHPKQPLTVGMKAPLFELPDGWGNTIKLTDYLAHRGLLVAFIHGTWCPVCMRGVMSLQRSEWFVRRVGVRIVVITQQDTASLSAFLLSQKTPLPFPILADKHGDVFKKYGLMGEVDLHGAKVSFYINGQGIIQKVNKGVKFGPLTPFGF